MFVGSLPSLNVNNWREIFNLFQWLTILIVNKGTKEV